MCKLTLRSKVVKRFFGSLFFIQHGSIAFQGKRPVHFSGQIRFQKSLVPQLLGGLRPFVEGSLAHILFQYARIVFFIGPLMDFPYFIVFDFLPKARDRTYIAACSFGLFRCDSITVFIVESLLNSRMGKSQSDTTKLKIVIQALFRQTVASRLIQYDPSINLTLPKTTKGKHRSITDEERKAILEVASWPLNKDGKKNRAGLWVLMILYCGLRPGETAALHWTDIDLNTGYITISAAKESGSSREKGPKTDAGVRRVPIPDIFLERLKSAQGKPQDYVFTQRDEKTPLTESSMKRMWEVFKKYVKYVDVELGAKEVKIKPEGKRKHTTVIQDSVVADDLVPYCLRHTYCTDLQRAGVPINVAKDLMGHSDISVTANIYTHTTDDVLDDAKAKINDANK